MNKICQNCQYHCENMKFLNFTGDVCFYPRYANKRFPVEEELLQWNQTHAWQFDNHIEFFKRRYSSRNLILPVGRHPKLPSRLDKSGLGNICYTEYLNFIPDDCPFKFEREILEYNLKNQ